MKKIFALLIFVAFTFCFLPNIHIIRTHDGIDMFWKERMTFQDTFADVRKWELTDFFTHAPGIRNYLIQKHYSNLIEMMKAHTSHTANSAKITLKELEANVHQWISERLR